MSTRSRLAVAGAAGLLLVALPAFAKTPPKLKPAPMETAVIENTGSTNTLGYKVTVAANGGMQIGDAVSSFADGGIPYTGAVKKLDPASASLQKAYVRKLFADLNAAMPLIDLPVRHGMRSASFGTETFITYKGQKSPDLTFASDPRTAALKADIDNITKALHVGNAPRRPIVVRTDPPVVIHADR